MFAGIQTIITVREDQIGDLPFDVKAIPTFGWNPKDSDAVTSEKLRSFWEQNIDRPPIVERRALI